MAADNTQRFSNRVKDYVRYRPGYPAAIITYLQQEHHLTPGSLVADIGAGTGISAKLFLDAGYKVIAVEPNKEMHDAAVALLKDSIDFSTTGGTAEATELDDHSVDAIVAGQAFHWFDREQAKAEFARVLKNKGLVVLIWNERLTQPGFEQEYEALIHRHARDYTAVDHRHIDTPDIEAFFHPHKMQLQTFGNEQVFDLEGLLGRLSSSSYMPAQADDGYTAMRSDLEQLFEKYQQNGFVTIHYTTKVYTGRLGQPQARFL
jgi:SAM-dependent methyltransferase